MPQIPASTSYTSPEFQVDVPGVPYAKMWIFVVGAGPAYIEKKVDGVWCRSPEATLSGPTERIVRVPVERIRIVVDAVTPTAVSYRY